MILAITFSNPAKDCGDILGRPYIRVRIRRNAAAGLRAGAFYDAEFFTKTQAFQKRMTEAEVESFIARHAGKTFKNAVERTDCEEISFLANRRGEVRVIHRKLAPQTEAEPAAPMQKGNPNNRRKQYILPEGQPVPFLIALGVMDKEGRVLSQKYDKFRQINRFLEFIADILDDVAKLCVGEGAFSEERPLSIADFGCGKSYLTFAVYYFLHEIRHIPVEIMGLDLKEEVIASCQKLAEEFGYGGLHFAVGNIAEAAYTHEPDIIITLHACDTATDYALNYAVGHGAKAILSVPCCQHELNLQLEGHKAELGDENPFSPLVRYGIIRERLAALATDALRAEILEQEGYSVQVLEFIDMAHTPKNLLIRAVKKTLANEKARADAVRATARSEERTRVLLESLHVSQALHGLRAKSRTES